MYEYLRDFIRTNQVVSFYQMSSYKDMHMRYFQVSEEGCDNAIELYTTLYDVLNDYAAPNADQVQEYNELKHELK